MSKLKLEVPIHIAIIPDGNRRWAKSNKLNVFAGHEKSASLNNLVPLLERAEELGVKYISFWAFSTENWSRPRVEISYLFRLIDKFFEDFKSYVLENEVRFRWLGRRDRVPENVFEKLSEIERLTKGFERMNVQICFDYGGRDEIMRAVNKALESGKPQITEEEFENLLDTKEIPGPDFIIRTSGEKRTSGFFSFQSPYAELYFEKKYFPDFKPADLKKAVEEFGRRKRNFGK